MSEIQRTPESMKVELRELDDKYATLDSRLADIYSGRSTGSSKEIDRIYSAAEKIKRNIYELLLALGDIQGIDDRLDNNIPAAIELYQSEGEPAFIEAIFEDTFGHPLDASADPRVLEVIENLVVIYDLESTYLDEEDAE
jgi:predicted transcriptional regulator